MRYHYINHVVLNNSIINYRVWTMSCSFLYLSHWVVWSGASHHSGTCAQHDVNDPWLCTDFKRQWSHVASLICVPEHTPGVDSNKQLLHQKQRQASNSSWCLFPQFPSQLMRGSEVSSENALLLWYQVAEHSADRPAKTKLGEWVCQDGLVLKRH